MEEVIDFPELLEEEDDEDESSPDDGRTERRSIMTWKVSSLSSELRPLAMEIDPFLRLGTDLRFVSCRCSFDESRRGLVAVSGSGCILNFHLLPDDEIFE